MGKPKSKSTLKSIPSGPVCNCDHPFNCDCGNRPERPSRGHKWDPETKQWGGKGHKQKGATIAGAQIGKKEEVVRAGSKLKQWMKLPTGVLEEWCKKEKRNRGKFKNLEEGGGGFRMRLILNDPKNPNKDLVFVSSNIAPTDSVSREEVALVGLGHIMSDRPIGKVLGEPYKTQWEGIVEDRKRGNGVGGGNGGEKEEGGKKKGGGGGGGNGGGTPPPRLYMQNRFVSKDSERTYRENAGKERKDMQRKKENRKIANKPYGVFMTRKIRGIVEKGVGRRKRVRVETVDSGKEGIYNYLKSKGFNEEDARWGAREGRDMVDGVCKLVRHMREEELPEGWKPRNGGGLEVVEKVGKEEKGKGAREIRDENRVTREDDEMVRLAGSHGITRGDAVRIVEEGDGREDVFIKVWKTFNRGEIEGEGDEEEIAEQFEALTMIDPNFMVRKQVDGYPFFEVLTPGSTQVVFSSKDSRVCLLKSGNVSTTRQARFQEMIKGEEGNVWECVRLADESKEGAEGWYSILGGDEEGGDQDYEEGSEGWTTNKDLSVASSSSSYSANDRRQRGRRGTSFFDKAPSNASPAPPPNPPVMIARQKATLPATKAKHDFLNLIKSPAKVILVAGATGCGKSTQIPQFILEKYPRSRVVVTQPRRIAATGVATRVASEYGCNLGGTVGYAVKGDSKVSQDTRLMFCTIGVLLRALNDGGGEGLDWIVVDEVHERSLDTDVLIGIVKRMLGGRIHTRVVLMSATMDGDKVGRYFGDFKPPTIEIPGRTFPVTDYFLKDALELSGYVPPKVKNSEKGDGSMACLIKRLDPKRVDYDFISCIVRSIVDERVGIQDSGSILIFLPGLEEISKTHRAISKICVSMKDNLMVLELHGGMKAHEQGKVFQKYGGKTKVILSTNVAQTSITIDDCTVVIDSCLEKQSSYDPYNRTPLLLTQICSKDALKQRRGRAGRVREGVCYKLVTRKLYENLSEHTTPEIERVALDSTILTIKNMGFDGLLRMLMSPPKREAVESAMTSLVEVGAVEEVGGKITNLGRLLAGLPVSVGVGKMMIFGALLGCRDVVLTIAAGMALQRSPFLKNMAPRKQWKRRRNYLKYLHDDELEEMGLLGLSDDDEEEDAEEARRRNIEEERKGLMKKCGHSDHSLLAAAFDMWDRAGRGADKRKVCERLGLSESGMREFKVMRSQLDSNLSSVFGRTRSDNVNGGEWRIVRTVIVSGLCPRGLVKVEKKVIKYEETMGGAVEKEGTGKELAFYKKGGGGQLSRVFVHPSSGCFDVGNYSCPWVANFELVDTSRPYLRDVSECTGFGLVLFGGGLKVLIEDGLIEVGGFARLSCDVRTAMLLVGLRERMEELIGSKVGRGGRGGGGGDGEGVMDIVKMLLVGEGL